MQVIRNMKVRKIDFHHHFVLLTSNRIIRGRSAIYMAVRYNRYPPCIDL